MAIIFFFQNEAKILHRHVFIAINILYKFGEDILKFINERDIKVYGKGDACTHTHIHIQKEFHNLPAMAFRRWRKIINSYEAVKFINWSIAVRDDGTLRYISVAAIYITLCRRNMSQPHQ